jgi:hypothetical protein
MDVLIAGRVGYRHAENVTGHFGVRQAI